MSREWPVPVQLLRKWWIALMLASAGCVLISLDPAAPDNGGQGGSATGVGGNATGTGGMIARGGSAGTATDAGQGGTMGCAGGRMLCGALCVDPQSDAANCGQCGKVCPTGNKCFAAQCCAAPAAGGTCNVPSCGCGAGQSCYPDTEATGLACFASTVQAEGADCRAMGAICAAPFGCFRDSCKRYCTVDSDCPSVDSTRRCDQTVWPSNNNIAGVSACRRICDPVTPQAPHGGLLSCPPGFGCFSSPAPTQGASDCIVAGAGGLNAMCGDDSDCLPGYYCTVRSVCNKYCFTNADCPGGGACTFFSTPEYAGTRQVGFCPVP